MSEPVQVNPETADKLRYQLEHRSLIGEYSNAYTVADRAIEHIRALQAQLDAVERLAAAARSYYRHYCVDEAEDVESCVCGRKQHEAARELRDAIRALAPSAIRAVEGEG